ncbi:hypothetical protein SOV_34520 [Sporomusa ovata DSM 2662]|uniref:Uncharacterized protein n=1 Tax=Sporomusa ovata TaxID=2378 RepID=A0A0U1L5M1_9FIRM|nr:hypothetical protein [Sporomusa ovata]EQB24600.1 hypothetical protein SOV_6c00140 [Sporomusa ovata DSM 2662]CQR74960.1 hypothetical protein SpAn4DRAFT_4317 [Sporomusa ovata]
MSVWTNLRDRIVRMLLGYGVSKAADSQNTGWVETREEIKKTAVNTAVEIARDKVLRK